MISSGKAFARRVLLTVCTVLCLGMAQMNTPAAALGFDSKPASFVRDHMYWGYGGNVIEITNTVYQSNGNTYAVVNGSTVQIVLNHSADTILDTNGNQVGFILQQDES